MANNALIGAVRAEATLESGKFVSGAKKIRQEAKATETQLKKSFSAMGAAAKGFGGALTAGLSIGLLAGAAKKVLDFAGSIGEVAQSLGVTTKELQTFRFAVQQNGGTVEQADQALGKFTITISKALSGSKQATEAFKAVGVSLNDLKTKSRSEILGQIADQMKATGGAAANAASGVAIFGKGFLKIGPTLDQGSAGLNALSAAAERLGVVLSDKQIQQADETADKLDAVRTVLAAQIAGVVSDNAASIVTLAQSLATLTSEIVRFLGSNPALALGIIGALAGSRFGLPGAAVGAVLGASAGGRLAQANEDANLDPRFRQQKFREARARLAKAQSLSSKTAPDAQLLAAQRELDKQRGLAKKAIAAANRPKAAVSAAAPLPQFLGGGGGGSKRTPRAPRDRSDDVEFQFSQELRRAQIDTLRAQQSLAGSSEERARIALELLDAERAMQEAELQDRVRRAERDFAEGKITAGTLEQVKAQAEALKAEYDSKDALERKAIADDLAAQKAADAAALLDSNYDLRLEQLQLESALADTAAERRDVELRILALMKEQEKARLEAVIADQQSSALAKAQAQQRLDQLDNIYNARASVVRQGTRGPLEQAKADFSDLSEEMENLKVQGIMGVADAFTTLLTDTENWKDATISMVRQVIAEFIRLQTLKFLFNLIGSSTGVPGLGSAGGSLAGGGIYGGIDPMFLGGFAHGGGFNVMGIPGIDKNVMSINGIPVANVSYGERVNVSNDNGAGSGQPIPPFIFNNYAKMSATEARETGMQAAAGFRQGIARANRKGF